MSPQKISMELEGKIPKANKAGRFKVVEKTNPLAVHALCSSRQSAEAWIRDVASWFAGDRKPFDNKELTPSSFTVEPV